MVVTPAEAKAIATSAYVFLTPLVTNYVAMFHEAVDPSSPWSGGAFGQRRHRRISTTTKSSLAKTHVTSLHSSSWLDLRSEPWVVSIPAVEAARVHAVRTSDLWGFVVDETTEAGDEVRVLIPSPEWMGEVPNSVDRVARGESCFVETERWVQMSDAGDLSQVRRTQQECTMTPLSALTGVAPPVAAPPVEWWPLDRDVGTGDEFWSVANFALDLTTPHPQDRAILERITEIGVVAGGRWDATRFDADVQEAIGEGIDDAVTELMRASAVVEDRSWIRRSRSETDRDYFGRALAALRHRPAPMSHSG